MTKKCLIKKLVAKFSSWLCMTLCLLNIAQYYEDNWSQFFHKVYLVNIKNCITKFNFMGFYATKNKYLWFFWPFIYNQITLCKLWILIEQKGMTFDHDYYLFILLFFFPLFLGGKRKEYPKSWPKFMPFSSIMNFIFQIRIRIMLLQNK